MDFGLSSDQQQFGASLKQLLGDLAGTAAVLRSADVLGFDAELWRGLCAMGAPVLGLPEAHGGLGGACLDGVVLAEALGTAAAPVPSIAPWHLAPYLISQCPAPFGDHWLPQIGDGAARIAVAISEAGTDIMLRRDRTRLDGTIRHLSEGAYATHLLVLHEDAVMFVDLQTDGVTVEHIPSLDRTVPLADVRLVGCSAEVLNGVAANTKLRSQLVNRARVLLAAQSIGAAQSMLDAAVSYVQVRRQFGQSLANFQAVRHVCAEMATMLEPARALVWHAAHAIDIEAPDANLIVCYAKSHTDEVGREIATLATQMHGAIGFTHELGLHLRLKRIATNRQLFGTPEQCRSEAAAVQSFVPHEAVA